VSILIATADRAFHGPGAFGGGDDFIQAEESQHDDSQEGNGQQKVQQAGLQNDILHERFQNDAMLEGSTSVYSDIALN
jgi:hypothetical protein